MNPILSIFPSRGDKGERQNKRNTLRLQLTTSKSTTTIVSSTLLYPSPPYNLGNSSRTFPDHGGNLPLYPIKQLLHMGELFMHQGRCFYHLQQHDRGPDIINLVYSHDYNISLTQAQSQDLTCYRTLRWWKYCCHPILPSLSRRLNQTEALNAEPIHQSPHQIGISSRYVKVLTLVSPLVYRHHHPPFPPHPPHVHHEFSWCSSNNPDLLPEKSTNAQIQTREQHILWSTDPHHQLQLPRHTIHCPPYQIASPPSPHIQPGYGERVLEGPYHLGYRSSRYNIQFHEVNESPPRGIIRHNPEYNMIRGPREGPTYQSAVLPTPVQSTHVCLPYHDTPPTELPRHYNGYWHLKYDMHRTADIHSNITTYHESSNTHTNHVSAYHRIQSQTNKHTRYILLVKTTHLQNPNTLLINLPHQTPQELHRRCPYPPIPHRSPNHHLPYRIGYTTYHHHPAQQLKMWTLVSMVDQPPLSHHVLHQYHQAAESSPSEIRPQIYARHSSYKNQKFGDFDTFRPPREIAEHRWSAIVWSATLLALVRLYDSPCLFYAKVKSTQPVTAVIYDRHNSNANMVIEEKLEIDTRLVVVYNSKPKYGGGLRDNKYSLAINNDNNTNNEILSVSSTSIANTDDWTSTSPHLEIRSMSQTNNEQYWTPPIILPLQSGTHCLSTSIPSEILSRITELCSIPSDTKILRSTRKSTISITTGNLQDLVSYGAETNDAIFSLYLELLCSTGNVTYMNTAFWPHLKQYGWHKVQRYFASSHSGFHARKVDRPHKTGENAIMIPLFIQGIHWVALVRREINGRVFFFYSDDMNQTNVETNVKQTIYTHTDHTFCPPNAQWIHCNSTFYIDHSNECGPRTLLALHILAFHPSPHENMLLPVMDHNIAQISRAWIAAALVTGSPNHDSLSTIFQMNQFSDTRHSIIMQSHPYDILPWRREHNNIETLSQEQDHTLHNDWEDQMESSSHHSTSLDIHTTDITGTTSNKSHERITTHPETSIVSGAMSLPTDIAHTRTNATLQQKRITDWTLHRPFFNGISPSATSTTIEASLPTGHMPPKIDPTRILRIVMQNPQFSLQLTNENYNTLKLTNNLKELSTAVFVAISPNVNWHNPSHRAKFKYPFNRAFKQVHLSSTSSEVGLLPNYISSQNLTGGVAI